MKTVFLFPGQGVQKPKMMMDVAENCSACDEVFAAANKAIGMDVRSLCETASEEELSMTCNSQPCILAAELCALYALRQSGIEPDYTVGFSLGEWAALVEAGVISIEQAFRIVSIRARLMQEAVPAGQGAMAVILKQSDDFVEELCKRADGRIWPTNYNCNGQVTIAGEEKGISSILTISQNEGFSAMRLPISVPSHCPMMEPAAKELQKVIADELFCAPRHPIVMNACGYAVTDAVEIRKLMISQLTSPVLFKRCIQHCIDNGAELFIELGPGKTLTNLVRKIDKTKKLCLINDVSTLQDTLDLLNQQQ